MSDGKIAIVIKEGRITSKSSIIGLNLAELSLLIAELEMHKSALLEEYSKGRGLTKN